MPSRYIKDLNPDLQKLCHMFLDECTHQGVKVGLSCTYRSGEEQDALYEEGRTKPGSIKTHARAGQSPHNCTDPDGNPASRAFDFFVYMPDGIQLDWSGDSERWKKAIKIGQHLGLVSGSTFKSFKDNPHMEMPDWKDI